MKKTILIILSILFALILYFVVKDEIERHQKDYLRWNVDDSQFDDIDHVFLYSSDYFQYKLSKPQRYPDRESIIIKGVDFSDASGNHHVIEHYQGRQHVV
jgi:hypothetical protein